MPMPMPMMATFLQTHEPSDRSSPTSHHLYHVNTVVSRITTNPSLLAHRGSAIAKEQSAPRTTTDSNGVFIGGESAVCNKPREGRA